MNKHVDQPTASLPEWDKFFALNGDSLQYGQRVCDEFLRGAKRVTAAQAEALAYLSDGWNKYVDGIQRLGAAESPVEALALHAELTNKAMSDFWDESRKLLDMLAERSEGRIPGRSK
jgi:hypothetical protein